MIAIKWLLACAMVVAGVAAWSYKDDVLAAFELDDETTEAVAPASSVPPTTSPLRLTEEDREPLLRIVRPADTRDAVIAPIGLGDDVPEISFEDGDARLSGVVEGPEGPVPGATVLIERFVDGYSASLRVGTNEAGAWGLSNIPGGRYRVRAWLQPTMTQLDPFVLWLDGDSSQSMRSALVPQEGREVTGHLRASSYEVGQAMMIGVTVRVPAVGDDGKVRAVGEPDVEVDLAVRGALSGGGTAVTGADGVARWQLRCTEAGSSSATATIGEETTAIAVPTCVEPPPPEPDPDEETDSGEGSDGDAPADDDDEGDG
ncbi:MAG: carboxypeptidase-like regulatory domain-containing protein [Actinomycetota bacterium]|nr:carboxypeptidase-like regulatory domain-containing protein [Actinomycetota bacterium]